MRHRFLIALCALLLAVACGRPLDRPLSGAPPPGDTYTPGPVDREAPPPTLAPRTAIAQNFPRQTPSTPSTPSTPTPPAGGRPILRNVQPAANSDIPMGEVRIMAQIAGFSDLKGVTATLNGQPIQPEVAGQDERHWTAFFTQKLEPGEHEVRVVAQDDQGRSGGYRWRFKVLPGPVAAPR